MNMNETFLAERRAAMHSDRLVAKPDTPSDGLGTFARFGEKLAPVLAGKVSNVLNTSGLEAEAGAPELMLAKVLTEKIGPVAGNFVLPVGDVGGRIFASFSLPPILDRLQAMFGGDASDKAAELTEKLPSSVELLLRRLASGLIQAIGECLDEAAIRKGEQAQFAADQSRLAVFPGQSDAVVMTITLTSEGASPIELLLACRPATMARLMTHFADGATAAPPHPRLTMTPVMRDIPLPLRARLATMKLPASRLLALKPGQTLPLAVARSVPIYAGNHLLATGAIGEQDDRVALQIDRVHFIGELS